MILCKLFKPYSLEAPGLCMASVLDLVILGAEKSTIGIVPYKTAIKAQLAPCPFTSDMDYQSPKALLIWSLWPLFFTISIIRAYVLWALSVLFV